MSSREVKKLLRLYGFVTYISFPCPSQTPVFSVFLNGILEFATSLEKSLKMLMIQHSGT